MSASHELEKAATAYALDAVRMDKQGQKGRAITLYQKAIESLLQLCTIIPGIRFKQSLRSTRYSVSGTYQSLTRSGFFS